MSPPKSDPAPSSDVVLRQAILQKLRIVIRAAQQHSSWIEKQCGVSGAQLWLMHELHEADGLRVGELANKLAIHQTTTSNLLDGLGKRGYIAKSRDPLDQRAVKVSLSDAGRHLLESAPKPARGLLATALTRLDPLALGQLDDGLQGLLDCIEGLDDGFGMLPLPFMM
ncbi:MAG TPA: MarR family transcriptional regulator [Janthinobacterium sp.]|nr:MarR family transcriptional regulator [Janthinobacterium sp.]